MSIFLNTFAFLLFGILIPIILLKSMFGKSLSWTIPSSETETSGGIRRSFLLQDSDPLKTTPHSSVKTLYDVLIYGARVYPKSKHLFGSRCILDTIKESKSIKKTIHGKEVQEEKIWSYLTLSEYKWLTYREVLDRVNALGAGLVALGLKPKDKVTIFHSTSAKWMTMSYACYSQNLTITTAYDSLGVEALAFSLNEAEVSTLFTQADLLIVVEKIGHKVPTLKNIIYSGKADAALLTKAKSSNSDFNFISFDDLAALGKSKPVPTNPATPDDLACIMYTSGSTGNPKGVMLSHKSMVAGCAAAADFLSITKGLLTGTDDYYLGYLPLAHVLEFLVENFCVLRGVSIGYGSPRTLTDASVRNCKGDIRELRPTLMAGVPAVWETIRKGIVAQLGKITPMQKYVFDLAFELKKLLIKWKLPASFMDKTIFKKIADGTGGRLRAAVSGGAPVAAETQEFLTITLCPVLQGYGMTESCGMMTMQTYDDAGVYGNVGSPSPGCEIKLVATNNYNPNPSPESTIPPRGELWVRGPIVMSGYYKQPEITAETLTEDGWLMSGDIAEWAPDGTLCIIDRKKNLVKLAHGEYVALEKLEAGYKVSSFVLNMCIHADPLKSHIVAIVVPDRKLVEEVQRRLQIGDDLSHPELVGAVGADFIDAAKKSGFQGAEVLKHFVLVDGEWTAENGMLTAAQKIKRKDIVQKYADLVANMYA